MKFTPSVNIERDQNKQQDYIVTANAKQAVANILSSFRTGAHAFTLIGSYGTGKSSFILAMEECLKTRNENPHKLLKVEGQLNGYKDFEFLNIVGEYASLSTIIEDKIEQKSHNIFQNLEHYYQKINKQNKFLIIVIDEFGKILEHAAKNDPEKEMYFLQQFTEFVNDTDKNILLLTTLHQGFNAYAKGLRTEQRQEWNKVKGRLLEIVFREPVEQLLDLAVQRMERKNIRFIGKESDTLYELGISHKFYFDHLKREIARKLYPMDIVAAYTFVQANQRYGQNERTFFNFLQSQGDDSLAAFVPQPKLLYNLVNVHDYITYHFHSFLSETNTDSANWTAIRIAMERIEGSALTEEKIKKGTQIIKVIGLLNLFASSAAVIDENFIVTYAENAMGFSDASTILDQLISLNIIRFAKYKSKFILFEGTDIDIDAGMMEAERMLSKGTDVVNKLNSNFNFKVSLANAYYYKIGTPRYFEYHISELPLTQIENGEADGYVNLLFAQNENLSELRTSALQQTGTAILYCIFKKYAPIIDALFEIDKLVWVKENWVADQNDHIALRELDNQIAFEKEKLSKNVLDNLYNSEIVEWIFNGKRVDEITDARSLIIFLSKISNEIYSKTPVFKNELVNKHKASVSIATARPIFLNRLLENGDKENLGFPEDKFPPEKSIYLSLLKQNGMHRQDGNSFTLNAPDEANSFYPLWKVCEDFLSSSIGKQRKISELIALLKKPPFRLKQGFIEFWVPIFLIMKKEDYALYSNGTYIPYITKETLELLQRTPNQFTVKAFQIEGVKYQFFQQYRKAIHLNTETALSERSFIETIKPFLLFYRKLNTYARTTKKLSPQARNFRDVIAQATDPEKTFFEILPDKLGFKDVIVTQNPEAIQSFVNVLGEATRALRECYGELIDTIEKKILSILKISEKEFVRYKPLVDARYRNVKVELMPTTMKNFHTRVISHWEENKGWIESLCYVILNKPLEQIQDAELPYLLATLQDYFHLLDDYVEMHKESNENVVRVHITRNKEKSLTKQVVLTTEAVTELADLEARIEKALGQDDSLNISALLQILKKKME